MMSDESDPFNEELHGLRLYAWVEAYLGKRGWRRAPETEWFDHPDLAQHVTIGRAFEIQLNDDGIDLMIAGTGMQ